MGIRKTPLVVLMLLSLVSTPAFSLSMPVDIVQASLFLSIGPDPSYQDDQLGVYQSPADPTAPPRINNFGDGGFGIGFESSLDDNNLGSMTWSITNQTSATIASASLMGFLDADLGSIFWQNYGAAVGSLNQWEIDEPGYLFGDIYDHLQAGILDSTNAVPAGSPEDVSLALGFGITDWMAGETILATFLISAYGPDNGPGNGPGLAQFDVGSQDAILFSAHIENIGVIPIPGSGGLMLTGLITLILARYRLRNNRAAS